MKPYPKYKDSGIEWLGKVPEGWEVKRLKYVAHCLDSKRIPLNSEERGLRQGEYPYYGANGVLDYVDKYLFDSEIVLLGEDGAPFNDPLKDVAFYVNHKCWVNNHAHVLRPLSNINAKYLTYILNCVDYSTVITGSTRDKLNQSEMENIFLSFPPLNEQLQISDFLDHKTVKVDELIKKNEKLIELLKEKRQAIISHAVTKGLDPKAKMKDSGVEWIGEVPEWWEVKKIKYVASINPEALTENTASDYEMKYVDISNVNEEGLINEPELIVFSDAPSRARRIIRKNDVIVSTVRTYLKAIAYFPNPDSNLIVSTGFAVLRTSNKITSKFLYYFVRSDFFVESIMINSVGVSYPAINSSVIASLFILLPSVNEQSLISNFLDQKTTRIDESIQKIQSQIETLKEYRQALISNVVTGKVKVS